MKTTGLNDLLHSTNDACKVINKDSLFSHVISTTALVDTEFGSGEDIPG